MGCYPCFASVRKMRVADAAVPVETDYMDMTYTFT